MTNSKTIPWELTGLSLTEQGLKEAKAHLWFLDLRLWVWKNQPHLRDRHLTEWPKWPNTKVLNEIEKRPLNEYAIVYKNVYAVPIWNITLEYVEYYSIYTRYTKEWLFNCKTIRYLDDAQIRRYSDVHSDVR